MVGHIIGKGDAGAAISRHDPHLDLWRALGEPPSINRKPMSLGEVETHRCIAACGHEAAGRRVGPETMRLEKSSALNAADAILSKQNGGRAAVALQHGRRGGKPLERLPSFLAARAIANDARHGRAGRFEHHAAASASSHHCVHPYVTLPRLARSLGTAKSMKLRTFRGSGPPAE
jgi:hypothetical protein